MRPGDIVVDVGAGTGRFALPLAERVAEVVAVDASGGMLERLRAEADRRGLHNVRHVHGPWPDVGAIQADVAICSYVLPLVRDGARFLRAFDRAARRARLVYLAASSADLLHDPLWRHFHDRPPPPAPTYLDAQALLAELGIDCRVEVVEAPVVARYASLDEAVAEYGELLFLPPDEDVRDELRRVLASWLVVEPEGLRAPLPRLPGAILSWPVEATGARTRSSPG